MIIEQKLHAVLHHYIVSAMLSCLLTLTFFAGFVEQSQIYMRPLCLVPFFIDYKTL